jgi:ParB family chromosome partitioning protein
MGLTPAETAAAPGAELDQLAADVVSDGGAVLARYREPFGGTPALLVALPLARVEPTPYQRDPSEPHVKRLMGVIETIGRFLDPIIAVREDGQLLVPDSTVAFKILALNTEKAHNLREKSLETIRMARALATRRDGNQPESAHAFEFEQPAFLTLGKCYEERPRFSGGAYQSILRRVDAFLDEPMSQAIKERERRGKKILKLDDAVSVAIEKLKAKGLTSPYLRPFVVSRVNYTRFSKATSFDFDETLDKIIASAAKFNVDKVKQEDVAKSGGGPADEE